jgi:hypothetical protein
MPCTPERVWRALQGAGDAPQVPWSEPPAAFDRLPGPGDAERPEAADVDI